MALRIPRPPICLSRRISLHSQRRLLSTSTTPTTTTTTTTTTKQALPPTAPKPTPNLRSIRESAEYHRQNCLNRNYPTLSTAPFRIVSLHQELTALQQALRADREQHNVLTSLLKKRSNTLAREEQDETTPKKNLLLEAKILKDKITAVEEKEKSLDSEMRTLALSLPNHTHCSTPIGKEPRVLGYINEHLAQTDWAAKKSHTDIGAELGLLDFTSASTVSGWGWYYLLDDTVLLEQALVSYALTLARERGWKLVSPPSIVYSHIASAAGFRPRDQHGEQQIYALEAAEGKFSHSLAGTAEIPLAGLGANRVFEEEELPLKVVGTGRAYRAEAGARGVESKGLYRVHEFTKVELFAWAPPDPTSAEKIFDEMLAFQTHLITSLGLYARLLEMPSTDLGASAHRKIDIEVYMPSREKKDPWGEVSSLSNCTDYQSRRLNTRAKLKGGARDFAWTLNGTAVAVPRILIALLEYGYVEGSVMIPKVLRQFMGGQAVISRRE